MKTIIGIGIAFAGVIMVVGTAGGQGIDIQARIDQAKPGDVVQVPAGTYRGNFRLKEGVALVGAGADSTCLSGLPKSAVVEGAAGALIKGFTITGGSAGISTNGNLMGIFENVIRDTGGVGVITNSGRAVLVNNLICGNPGKAGIEAARSYVLAANNTICGSPIGVAFWNSPESRVANNVIAFCRTGIKIETFSKPELENNDLWANEMNYDPGDPGGKDFSADPYFVNDDLRDYRLLEDSPLRTKGIEVPGLPAELTASVGCTLPATFPLEMYQKVLEESISAQTAFPPVVFYELLEQPGSFRVTTKFCRPAFKVTSSSENTWIDEVAAFDAESSDPLLDRLVNEEPPSVEVEGKEGVAYPVAKERYVMDGVFHKPESYLVDGEGKIHFQRQTNFGLINLIVPDGYQVDRAEPAGQVDPEGKVVAFSNPGMDLIDLTVVLSPK